jgi:polar amino acid transport system substrate-binding protein
MTGGFNLVKNLMQMDKKLAVSLLSLLFSISFPLSVWAETVLEKVSRTGVLTAGVRTDAVPFGYTDKNDTLQGYSVDLIKLIQQRLEKQLNKPIKLELKTVDLKNRFNQVETGKLDIVCEATSITPEREQKVDFSTPYFTSGIQLLAREADAERLNPTLTSETKLKTVRESNITVGFLLGTTTDDQFRPIYPEAKWRVIGSRADGIRRLKAEEIDLVASDGILLLGELWRQGLDFKAFALVPSQPLTFENYGCILPKNSSQWGTLVNQTITSEENTQLWNKWFDPKTGRFPYQRFQTSTKS